MKSRERPATCYAVGVFLLLVASFNKPREKVKIRNVSAAAPPMIRSDLEQCVCQQGLNTNTKRLNCKPSSLPVSYPSSSNIFQQGEMFIRNCYSPSPTSCQASLVVLPGVIINITPHLHLHH